MNECPWLLLLYSLPTKQGSARVGIWRKLKKSGALPFKTSAYLLPNRSELLERFQWLAQQIQDAGGEATLVFVKELEGVAHEEMVRQFNEARAQDYATLAEPLNELIARHRKKPGDTLDDELEKIRRRYDEVNRMDFFDCPAGQDIANLMERAAALPEKNTTPESRKPLSSRRFTGKIWLTRPRPGIDRVGSAWLILKFIDPEATFVFGANPADHSEAIPYDMVGVEFTHHGDDCTFETLIKRFDLKDKALRKIAEAIHDADLEDGKFQAIEAIGIDRILRGWAKLGLDDHEILTRGLQCFDALHEHFKR